MSGLKSGASTVSQPEYQGSTTRQFLYAPSGAKIAKMNGQTLDTARVPLPGGAIADYHASGFNAYGHADWLGTTRFGSTATRTKDGDWAFAPFGEVYAGSSTSYSAFTGQNSDMGSNLWDFSFREYHSTQGRWISPDPAGLAAVNPMNPQTWNRYGYVGGNPLSAIDPLGLFSNAPALAATDLVEGSIIVEVGSGSGCVGCNKSLTARQDTGGTGLNAAIGTDAPNNGQKSYADCVKDSGNYFSLQNGLQSISGGQWGNGFWSGAILGNPVSDAIEGVQNVFSGNWSGAGGRSGSIFGGKAAENGAEAASQIPNISLTTVAATTTTVQAPGASISVTSVNVSTMTLPTGLVGQGAKVAAGALEDLNIWNYGVSAVSAMICAIGR